MTTKSHNPAGIRLEPYPVVSKKELAAFSRGEMPNMILKITFTDTRGREFYWEVNPLGKFISSLTPGEVNDHFIVDLHSLRAG